MPLLEDPVVVEAPLVDPALVVVEATLSVVVEAAEAVVLEVVPVEEPAAFAARRLWHAPSERLP